MNCLCFSQVMLPCPRKPNSLFLYFFLFFVYRISLHLCTSVCVCVYTYNVLYNIIFILLFFSFLFVFSLSIMLSYSLFSFKLQFCTEKTRISSFLLLEYYVTKTHSIMISNIILIILLILILLYPRYYAFINRVCR